MKCLTLFCSLRFIHVPFVLISFLFSVFSATLYYIIKGRDKHKYGTPFKNHIIRTLLNGMSTHITDEVCLLYFI